MKKILLLVFILFCGLIFYQNILGKNGLIAGYQIRREKKVLLRYKELLKQQIEEQDRYIDYLKSNEEAYLELANELGFFHEPVDLIKVKKNQTGQKTGAADADHYLKKYIEENMNVKMVNQLRIAVSILFYLFFGFFVILIIFSGQKDE